MALLNQSVQVYAQLGKLFETLRQGQAPEKFSREFIKDIGFKSSNHHAFIPLLKGLGFLTSEGVPTQRYREFLDSTKSKKIMAEAVKEAYSDIFVIKSKPSTADRKTIAGKFKSTYNLSDSGADRAAGTFLALLGLADEDTLYGANKLAIAGDKEPTLQIESKGAPSIEGKSAPLPAAPEEPYTEVRRPMGLHYNIQIHLPATKDVEVYNAIFKSIREHLID